MGLADHIDMDQEGAVQALLHSFAMIIFSEIGDKTFLIAGILSMRHPRLTVFLGAFSSLVVMSILSAALGHVFPSLIPKSYTQAAAAVLFFVFGGKMLKEGKEMKGGNEKIQEEIREAEEEIEASAAGVEGTGGVAEENGEVVPLEEMEEGGRPERHQHHRRKSSLGAALPRSQFRAIGEGIQNLCQLVLGPVFVQAFVLTFLGEWGDRSQIATIALGAAHNMYLVTFGTIIGHSCCTALAVIGGRYISTKISVKHVTLGGAVLFILFGFIYLYEAVSDHLIPVSADLPGMA